MTRFQCLVSFTVFTLSNLLVSGQIFDDEYFDDMMMTRLRRINQPHNHHRCKPREAACRADIECCTKRCIKTKSFVRAGLSQKTKVCKTEDHYEREPDDRIIMGEMVNHGENPSMANVKYFGKHRCGASIINQFYVLTAAHCFYNELVPRIYSIVTGSLKTNHRSIQPAEYRVSQIIIHEKYTSSAYGYDIALLRTSTPMAFVPNYVEPVQLAVQGEDECEKATAWGWGFTHILGALPSDDLLKVEVPKVDHETCDRKHIPKERKIYDDRQICYGTGGKDSCGGDSGGPLTCMVNNKLKQIGIVSYGFGCADEKYPGVYTRVSAFYDWIYKKAN